MTKVNLKVVGSEKSEKPAKKKKEVDFQKAIGLVQSKLMSLCVDYVLLATSVAELKQRTRDSSSWSGIPLTLIEVEVKRCLTPPQ